MQLNPADLGENGLTAEIFLLGQDTPLTSVSYRRADIDDLTKRIVGFEARLAQVTQSTTVRFNAMNNEVKQRLDVMQQRIDAFIEYAASFMFDRMAASEVPTVAGATPLSPELRAKVDAFLSTIRGTENGPSPRNGEEATIVVPLESKIFSFGWNDVEEKNGIRLRSMSDIAVTLNPFPDRPVAEILMTLAAPDDAAQPSLRAAFDGAPAICTVERDKRKNNACRVKIRPAEGEMAATCRALSLVNLTANGTPGRGARQKRVVPACSELSFTYAG
jgi:hypothetical protein